MTTFSRVNTMTTDGGITIFQYSDVTRRGVDSDEDILNLEGNWFIIETDPTGYGHFIYDSIGQYYALKTIVTDLKPLILVSDWSTRYSDSPDFVWWCVDKLMLENDATLLDGYLKKSFTIENLYISSNEWILFFKDMGIKIFTLLSNDKYQDFVLPELRKFFLRHIQISDVPGKVYMSRKDKSGQLALEKEYLEYLKLNGVSWEPIQDGEYLKIGETLDPNGVINKSTLPSKFNRLGSWNKSPAFLELEVTNRYMSNEDEEKLEKFFKDSGYLVVSHGDMTYEEQISTIANASHYATFTASSVVSSVACREDAIIYILNHNTTSRRTNHLEYLPTVLFKNSHSVFSNNDYPGQQFSVDEIINRLKVLGV